MFAWVNYPVVFEAIRRCRVDVSIRCGNASVGANLLVRFLPKENER